MRSEGINSLGISILYWGRLLQKAISGNPGLKFNRLFILVCSTWQLQLKFSKAKHFIVCMISEQKFSNIVVYIFIILSTKFPLIMVVMRNSSKYDWSWSVEVQTIAACRNFFIKPPGAAYHFAQASLRRVLISTKL